MRAKRLTTGLILFSTIGILSLPSAINWRYEAISANSVLGNKPAAAYGPNECCLAPYWEYKLVGKQLPKNGGWSMKVRSSFRSILFYENY